MGYVAVKGGQEAIEHANELVEYYRLKDCTEPIRIEQAIAQFRLAIDRAMAKALMERDYGKRSQYRCRRRRTSRLESRLTGSALGRNRTRAGRNPAGPQ